MVHQYPTHSGGESVKKTLLAAAAGFLAAIGMACQDSPTKPVIEPLSVTPPSIARMTLGQSVTFSVRGGLDPIRAQVSGCLFGTRSCAYYNIDGSFGYPQPAFRLERSGPGGRTIRVTFIDDSLDPVYAVLDVHESNSDDVTQFPDGVFVDLLRPVS
jgi:hypothetical protein